MFNDLGLTDDQVVAGSTHPLRWLHANIDLACRAIAVRMHVNFRSRALTDEQELKLITLARYGVAKFWSRNIQLNNVSFRVDVSLTPTSAGTEVWLEINDRETYYARSFNTKETGTLWPFPGAVIYYQPNYNYGYPEGADEDFKLTAAHEIGHSILARAGGRVFSWGHKGTSGEFGGDVGKMPPVPTTGNMDLMKYHQARVQDRYSRSIASESDVKNLIYISRR
jgi:hypothetical protein